MKIVRLSLTSIGLLIGIFLLAVAIANPEIFKVAAYAPFASFSTTNANYNSAKPSQGFTQAESAKGDIKEVHIAFRFRVNRIKKYDDLFQTGPVNSGIRAEITKPGTLGVIVGSKLPAGYRSYVVPSAISIHQWHDFDLTLSRAHRMQINFDDHHVTDEVDPDVSVDLSRIVLGNGVNGTRPFDGQISNGTVSYAFLKPAWWAGALDTIARVAAILLIVVCGGFLLADIVRLLPTREQPNAKTAKRRNDDEDFGAAWRD